MMSPENWDSIARECMEQESLLWFFFVPFIVFTNYTLLNLVTAVVVEKVLVISQREQMNEAKRSEESRFNTMWKLKQVFDDMDKDGDGVIDAEEFRASMMNPHVVKRFHELEIAVYEAEDLFEVLDITYSGQIAVNEFVEGCLRVKGDAKAKHPLTVQYDLQKFWNDMHLELENL